jgi:hypothetical protein
LNLIFGLAVLDFLYLASMLKLLTLSFGFLSLVARGAERGVLKGMFESAGR